MILTANEVSVTINNPQWDYETKIKVSIRHSEVSPKGYVGWDDGIKYDFRICRFTCRINSIMSALLISVYTLNGRGINATLSLGTNSGFYPFGPDYGDSGDFTVRLIDFKPGKVNEEPWQYFDNTVEMIMVEKPEYSLPIEISEGDLQIGTIYGLRYPPDFPQSESYHSVYHQITDGGISYSIDKTSQGDNLHTVLPMLCNHSKSAALINHLTTVVRESDLSIIASTNNWVFGNEGLNSGPYLCKFLNKVILIKHQYFNGFSFDLSFYRIM